MSKPQKIITSLFAADGARKYLTTSEVRRFLFQADKCEARVRLLCQMLAYSGCRLSEALQLTRSSIDLETQTVTIHTLKQRKSNVYRQVPMPRFLLNGLVALLQGQDCGRLWPVHRQTARRWVERVMDAAHIDGVRSTTRGLRHGFAVGCIEEDIPITLLQKWLGHSRIETTAIYVGVVGAQERAFAERNWVRLQV